jgi:hypothetical protein
MSEGASVREERWVREEHELEVKELRNKVKFLINKLESMQENRPNGEMVHSKMVLSNASVDSFRFANSAVSSKEPAPSTRRNTSGMKGQV